MPQSAASRSLFSFFPRLRQKWQGNLRFRHTVILSSIILAIMIALSGTMLFKQRAMLYHAAETKGMAFTKAFAISGWAAIHNNLFRIQEVLMTYPPDPEIQSIEIIDQDNMIIASQIPGLIGLTLESSEWLNMKQQEQIISRYTVDKAGEPQLIMTAPLTGKGETKAWIRITFSLEKVYQEEIQYLTGM